ncbi:MAG TPA: hypothetical protein VG273_21270 [Bryobacteraceae bacterium]|jgi:hypothetical protein|nr:hypothetical protein [Bryobacteraceae bacterium]
MNIEDRCDAIEECYEYMLAYAAKGINGDESPVTGNELRHFMIRALDALSGIAEACRDLQPPVKSGPFLKVLERDASDSFVSFELVLAQPFISSQLIDNLNASMHLRALLADLFLMDEVVKIQTKVAAKPATAE